MDRKSLKELQQTIASSRHAISQRSAQFRQQMDVKKQATQLARKYPWQLLSASLLSGYVLQLLFLPKKTPPAAKPLFTSAELFPPKQRSTQTLRKLLWSTTTFLARPYLQKLATQWLNRDR